MYAKYQKMSTEFGKDYSIDISYDANKIKTEKTILQRFQRKIKTMEFDYFMMNILIFVINICIGIYMKNYVIAGTSSIALLISVIVFGEDYNQTHIWLLNQIAVLSIIVPGFCLWIFEKPEHKPLAGLFFIVGGLLYITGLYHRIYGNSPNNGEREKWHLYLHLFTTAGHQMIMFESLMLTYLGLKDHL